MRKETYELVLSVFRLLICLGDAADSLTPVATLNDRVSESSDATAYRLGQW